MIMSSKGYMFIIIVMITIGLISGIIIITRSLPKNDSIIEDLVKNYEQEFSRFSITDVNEETTDAFQKSFIYFIKARNHDIEVCSIFADNDYYYVSNYLDEDCDFYVNDVNISTIVRNSTQKIDRFINDTNIYLCNCEYKNIDSYYIKINDSKNQIIKKNTR